MPGEKNLHERFFSTSPQNGLRIFSPQDSPDPPVRTVLTKAVLIVSHLCSFTGADLLPENCVEEKTKSFDPNAVMAEIKHDDRPGVQLK